MLSVLITGSSGLIGTILANRLSGEFKLYGLDRNPGHETQPEFFAVDITDSNQVEAAAAEKQLQEDVTVSKSRFWVLGSGDRPLSKSWQSKRRRG